MHTQTEPQPPDATEGLLLGLANLFLLTELQMQLGLDPDGSTTTDRALGALRMAATMAPALRTPPGLTAEGVSAAHSRLLGRLEAARPLMARLARPTEPL